jgi:beta-lactamase regulating signal transducer with metallopeptidase domain
VILLLDWIVDGFVVAIVAAAAVRVVPARYAAQRHVLLWIALVSIVALPAASLLRTPVATGDFQPSSAVPVPAVLVVPVLPDWTLTLLLALWACIAIVGLIRLVGSLAAVRQFVKRSHPLSADVEAGMAHLARARTSSRSVAILMTDAIDGACAVGYLRPRVVLSRALLQRLDPSDVEAVVLHEYAHLQRFDDWTRLVQRLLIALFGVHPAVRWIAGQIEIECEAACDRHAVRYLDDVAPYAHALLKAGALVSRSRAVPALAPAAIGGRAGLHGRVVRLLAHTRVTTPGANSVLAVVATAVVGVAGVALVWPPLVATAAIEGSIVRLSSRALPTASATLSFDASPLPPSSDDAGMAIASHRVAAVSSVVANQGEPMAAAPFDTSSAPGSGSQTEPMPSPGSADVRVMPLSAVALPQFAPMVSSGSGGTAAPGSGWGALASGAAGAGVNAGDAMSRAGAAIGRSFKRGGLAIARSF